MTSRSGGLLELVARGKKDVFFTSNPTVSFIHSVYRKAAPFSSEIYVLKPRNNPEWGKWFEFEYEHRGDLCRNLYLLVDLPTWLPDPAVLANQSGIVTDASGVTYGYCNDVGFQMLDRIQFFQDQVLLHEAYGEMLDWKLAATYPLGTSLLVGDEIGHYDDTTSLGIGRAASPSQLRVPLPLLGWQALGDPGFPSVCLRSQRFRIRILLRPLSDLLVASDGRLSPKPWGLPLRIQRTKGGPVDTSQTSLDASVMKNLVISLETTQVYVPADVQLFLKSQTLRFPYRTLQFQQYTIADNQFVPAAPPYSTTVQIPLAVDFIGSVSQLLFAVRSETSTQAGQRLTLRPPSGSFSKYAGQYAEQFITSARLTIANLDRVKPWDVATFRESTAYWKQTAMTLTSAGLPAEIYNLTFGGFDYGAPAGTLNLTRASLPVLTLTLASTPYDPRTISRKAFVLLYAESWNVFEITGGKGRMMFDDS